MRLGTRLAPYLLIVLSLGCGGERPAGGAALEPTPLPALDRFDEPVKEQLRAAHARVAGPLDAGADPNESAEAFGELGMDLHAYGLHAAAAPCYRNASALAPGDFRWPHLLADVLMRSGDGEAALAAYREALARRPDYLPALVWSGRLELEANRADEAEALFRRAVELDPDGPAALVGLGRVDAARGEFESAARRFERALELAPGANNVHYQLAMAYRSLGDLERAEIHLARRGPFKPGVADPVIDELRERTTGARALQERGMRLGQQGRYNEAIEVMRRAVELAPGDPVAQLYLGVALTNAGQTDAALAAFRKTLELDPKDERANLFLGSMLAERGDDGAAMNHFLAAAKANASLASAHLELAKARMRSGRPEQALAAYAEAIRVDPGNAEARLGRAFALVALQRYAEAREALERDVAALPDQAAFTHALARVLAASPDPAVRDGNRSFELGNRLAASMRTTDLAETIAMALAETGRFGEAARMQRSALEFARRSAPDAAVRMEDRLRLYESRRPCREPWSADDPVFRPQAANLHRFSRAGEL